MVLHAHGLDKIPDPPAVVEVNRETKLSLEVVESVVLSTDVVRVDHGHLRDQCRHCAVG